jgi:hypothetical protein
MKRFRVAFDGADGKRFVVVSAGTQKEARGNPRVAGKVIEVTEVIPNVSWRGKWGYYFTAAVDGKRYCETLDTEDPKVATERARIKIEAIKAKRWSDLDRTRTKKDFATIGELVEVYEAAARRWGRPAGETVVAHVGALRGIVAIGLGIDKDQVDATRVDAISGDLARRYGDEALAGPWADMEHEGRTRRTVHAKLLHARAIFGPEWWQEYREAGMNIPEQAWREFRERFVTDAPAVRKVRPAEELIVKLQDAAGKLMVNRPDLWAVWLLSKYLGLRAREQSFVRWTWFRELPGGGAVCDVIRREAEGYKPKRSEGGVAVHRSVWAALLALKGESEFVLPRSTRNGRYGLVTRDFADWMRGLGWDSNHYSHDLRWLGHEEVCELAGDREGELWLRHGPVTLADRSYRGRVAKFEGLALKA